MSIKTLGPGKEGDDQDEHQYVGGQLTSSAVGAGVGEEQSQRSR